MLYVNKSIDHFYYCFGMCSIIQLLLMFNEPHSQATFCSVYCLGDYSTVRNLSVRVVYTAHCCSNAVWRNVPLEQVIYGDRKRKVSAIMFNDWKLGFLHLSTEVC